MNKEIIVSSLIDAEICKELKLLNISYYYGGKSKNIDNEIAYHPDILYYPLLSGGLLVEANFNIVNNLDTNFKIISSKSELIGKYPNDCIFNCFTAGKYLITGKSVANEITVDAESNGYTTVYVKQGYAACSTVRLPSNAYICSDKGISAKLKGLGFDVLYVSNNGIALHGYDNGFIGGCALYCSKDLVAFSGNIKAHGDYENIKSFCANYGIYLYSLSNKPLYDYGGYISLDQKHQL